MTEPGPSRGTSPAGLPQEKPEVAPALPTLKDLQRDTDNSLIAPVSSATRENLAPSGETALPSVPVPSVRTHTLSNFPQLDNNRPGVADQMETQTSPTQDSRTDASTLDRQASASPAKTTLPGAATSDRTVFQREMSHPHMDADRPAAPLPESRAGGQTLADRRPTADASAGTQDFESAGAAPVHPAMDKTQPPTGDTLFVEQASTQTRDVGAKPVDVRASTDGQEGFDPDADLKAIRPTAPELSPNIGGGPPTDTPTDERTGDQGPEDRFSAARERLSGFVHGSGPNSLTVTVMDETLMSEEVNALKELILLDGKSLAESKEYQVRKQRLKKLRLHNDQITNTEPYDPDSELADSASLMRAQAGEVANDYYINVYSPKEMRTLGKFSIDLRQTQADDAYVSQSEKAQRIALYERVIASSRAAQNDLHLQAEINATLADYADPLPTVSTKSRPESDYRTLYGLAEELAHINAPEVRLENTTEDRIQITPVGIRDTGMLTIGHPVTVEHSDGKTATYHDLSIGLGVRYASARQLPEEKIIVPDLRDSDARKVGSVMRVNTITMTGPDDRQISFTFHKEIRHINGKDQVVYTVQPTDRQRYRASGFENGIHIVDMPKSDRLRLYEVLTALLGNDGGAVHRAEPSSPPTGGPATSFETTVDPRQTEPHVADLSAGSPEITADPLEKTTEFDHFGLAREKLASVVAFCEPDSPLLLKMFSLIKSHELASLESRYTLERDTDKLKQVKKDQAGFKIFMEANPTKFDGDMDSFLLLFSYLHRRYETAAELQLNLEDGMPDNEARLRRARVASIAESTFREDLQQLVTDKQDRQKEVAETDTRDQYEIAKQQLTDFLGGSHLGSTVRLEAMQLELKLARARAQEHKAYVEAAEKLRDAKDKKAEENILNKYRRNRDTSVKKMQGITYHKDQFNRDWRSHDADINTMDDANFELYAAILGSREIFEAYFQAAAAKVGTSGDTENDEKFDRARWFVDATKALRRDLDMLGATHGVIDFLTGGRGKQLFHPTDTAHAAISGNGKPDQPSHLQKEQTVDRQTLADRHPDWPEFLVELFLNAHRDASDFEGLRERILQADLFLYEDINAYELGRRILQQASNRSSKSSPDKFIARTLKRLRWISGAFEGYIRAVYGTGVIVAPWDVLPGDDVTNEAMSEAEARSYKPYEGTLEEVLPRFESKLRSIAELHQQRDSITVDKNLEIVLSRIFAAHRKPRRKKDEPLVIVRPTGRAHEVSFENKLQGQGIITRKIHGPDTSTTPQVVVIKKFLSGEQPTDRDIARAHLEQIIKNMLSQVTTRKSLETDEFSNYLMRVTSQFSLEDIGEIQDLIINPDTRFDLDVLNRLIIAKGLPFIEFIELKYD